MSAALGEAHSQALESTKTAKNPSQRALEIAEKYGLLALFVILLLVFSLWGQTSATFPTMANLAATVGNQATLLVISIGMVVPLLAGEIDLSVGATAGASSVVTAAAMANFHTGLLVAIIAGLVFALIVGVIIGILVARVSANSFVITFGVATVL